MYLVQSRSNENSYRLTLWAKTHINANSPHFEEGLHQHAAQRKRERDFRILCRTSKGLHTAMKCKVNHFLNCVLAVTVVEQDPATGIDL